MTQDERWNKRYQDVMEFLAKNHRNPSRHRLEEHDILNWMKHNKKLYAVGEMKEDRRVKFMALMELSEKYRHVNQWK